MHAGTLDAWRPNWVRRKCHLTAMHCTAAWLTGRGGLWGAAVRKSGAGIKYIRHLFRYYGAVTVICFIASLLMRVVLVVF